MKSTLLAVCLLSGWSASPSRADDWPQWLGPERASVWRETGLVEKFPAGGLKVLWRTPVAGGYSGPAVAGGQVYVMDYEKSGGTATNSPGERDKLEGRERVLCLDAKTGRQIWQHQYDCPYHISYPVGPRCTPTVSDGKVYALGAEGRLTCLDAKTGKTVWFKELKEAYDTEAPVWGFAASPLVDGDKLVCLVGGQGSVAVAFDKNTGNELWRSLSASGIGYCPPSVVEAAGTRQLVVWDADGINSLNPQTGESYWSVPLKPDYEMSIAVPRKSGDYLFASGIGEVGACYELDQKTPGAEVVWRGGSKTGLYSANSTPFIEDGTIYGCDCRPGALRAVDLKTGERLWETYEPTTGGRRAAHATAFLVKHAPSGRFFLFNEQGDLILANLTRAGYEELSRFHVLEPTSTAFGRDVVWSHPAFANRCVYARNDKEVVCVSLAK